MGESYVDLIERIEPIIFEIERQMQPIIIVIWLMVGSAPGRSQMHLRLLSTQAVGRHPLPRHTHPHRPPTQKLSLLLQRKKVTFLHQGFRSMSIPEIFNNLISEKSVSIKKKRTLPNFDFSFLLLF